MKTQAKAFNLSLVIHVFMLLMIAGAGSFMPPHKPPMVIDFTIESAPGRPAVKSPQPVVKKPKPTPVAKRQALPEPSKQVAAEKSVEPVLEQEQTLQQESSVSANADKEAEKPVPQPQPIRQASASNAGADDEKNRTTQGITETKRSSDSGAASPESEKARYIKENFAYIRDTIQKKMAYPLVARKRGLEGKVIISFIVSSDGHVRDILIKEGSGFEALDNNAVETVAKASPFPKPPIEAQLIIPVRYELK